MDITEIVEHSKQVVQTKQDLFLRLSAINLLNALIKREENKSYLNYGMIKPKAIYLVKNIVSNNKLNLCDELYIKPSEDCLYIRCYGLQFGFHRIGAKALVEEFPHLCNEDDQWDGIKLQPLADALYDLAKETIAQGLDEQTLKSRIQSIINQ